MITEPEFQRVQQILHRESNPRPQTEFALPFRGLIKCGECGSSITAHFKEQVRCTQCGYKSSVKNHPSCAKCNLPVSKMKAPKRRRYVYYHCTRTLNSLCRQKCISASGLEKQLTEKLKAFGLPPELRDWGMEYIEKLRHQELDGKRQVLAERTRAHDQCALRLENLVKLKTAPENADGTLLSDEEYQKQRTDLLAQKSKLATNTAAFETELNEKASFVKEALAVAAAIEEGTENDDAIRKREVLAALGLNHTLKEKELEIRPEFPFSELPGQGNTGCGISGPIEPENIQAGQSQNGNFTSSCPSLERDSDEDRTKMLKRSLEIIWKKMDLSLPTFKRYPFTTEHHVYRPCRRRGRFVSPSD